MLWISILILSVTAIFLIFFFDYKEIKFKKYIENENFEQAKLYYVSNIKSDLESEKNIQEYLIKNL